MQIECYLEGKRKYLSTGIKVKPLFWDNRINRVKKNHDNFILLNQLISQQLKNIEDFEMKYLEKEGFFSLDLFNKLNAKNQTAVNQAHTKISIQKRINYSENP